MKLRDLLSILDDKKCEFRTKDGRLLFYDTAILHSNDYVTTMLLDLLVIRYVRRRYHTIWLNIKYDDYCNYVR